MARIRLPRRRSKYGAVRTVVDGINFDSKKEAIRYQELKLLERAGEITELDRQVPYRCEIDGDLICTYKADFQYLENGWKLVCEDVKGFRTPLFKLKKKLVQALFGVEIREV
jgi:hypothetical protein